MLSLAKATTEEAIRTFCGRFEGQVFRVSEKLDGLSLSIVYEDGELDYVATRGTGTLGELVTEKARHVILGLPHAIEEKGRVEIRGEALMPRSTWQAYNDTHPDKPLTNPRNGAAGTLMQKDSEAAAADGRLLRFFAFGAERGAGEDIDPEAIGIELVHQTICDDADGVIAAIDAIGERRDTLDYDIDGAVIRLHTPAAFEAAGFNAAEPRGAIAFKYPPEEKLTKLLKDEWQVGKVGRVAPRAKVEPVFVGGVTVENVTLHNPRLIRERDLRRRRHRGGRPARRRHPVRRALDPRGPRRDRGGHRAARRTARRCGDRARRSAAPARSAGARTCSAPRRSRAG